MKREPMASEREHDKWLARMLRRRSADTSAASTSGICLDAETLAAWADGSLNPQEIAAAEIHASDCARCIALIAAIARTAPPAPAETRSRSSLLRWLVPLTAVATAVAIWVAIPGRQPTPAVREGSSRAVTVTPSQAPPSETAMPAPEARSALEAPDQKLGRQQGQSAQADDLSARARSAPPPQGVRKEQEAAASDFSVSDTQANAAAPAPQARRAVPTPGAAPVPPASADTFKSNVPVAPSALNETVTAAIEGMSQDDPQIRWRSPSGVDVERSIDGGQTWTKTASNPPGPIAAIRVVDALNAAVTTSDGRTFSTTDGGATWVPMQEKPAAPF
jgi:hypothetical protein